MGIALATCLAESSKDSVENRHVESSQDSTTLDLVVSCVHADKTCGLSTVTDDQQSKLLSELESIESACTREPSNW